MKRFKVFIKNKRLIKKQIKMTKKYLISKINGVIDPDLILMNNPFIIEILKYKKNAIMKDLRNEISKIELQNSSSFTKIFNSFLKNNTIGGLYDNKYDKDLYRGKIDFEILSQAVKSTPKSHLKNARIITKKYNDLTSGKKFNYNTIRNGLKYLGYSFCRRKKVDINALSKKNISKRIIFANELLKFISNDFTIINIDETCLSRKMRNCKDWLLKTQKIVYSNDRQLKTLSAISAVSSRGYNFSIIHESTVNSSKFRDFLVELKSNIEEIPYLKSQFDNKKIVLLLDNSTVHKDVETLKEFTDIGFFFLFNVPYSPRYVYIEEVFSYVKRKMLYDNLNTKEKRMASFNKHMQNLCQYKVQQFYKHSISTIIEDIDYI